MTVELKGTLIDLQALDDYRTGRARVLLLSAKNMGAGLSLPTTSDIIFYHYVSPLVEWQLTSRANRIGRPPENQLRVHYLADSG